MLKRLTLFTILSLAAAVVASAPRSRALAAGDDVPSWLRQAAAASAPSYDSKVPAVVLLKDCNVVVSDDGRVVKTTNYAVKILTREGRGAAQAVEQYLTD